MAYHELPVIAQIGKNGLTQGSVDQIVRDLEHRRLVKIKIRKSALDPERPREHLEELTREVAERTKSEVMQRTGFTLVLRRR